MRLRVSPRARKRALLVNGWWKEERAAAPSLFLDELYGCFELLLSSPEMGPVVKRDKKRREVRRVLLQRTQQYLYYRVDKRREVLHVITVWGAQRGRLPAL